MTTPAVSVTAGTGAFPTLFSPIRIGPRTSRNRIVNAGHGTSLAPGRHNEELFSYEETRARGGAGIVTTQSQWINRGAGDFDVRAEVASGAYDELSARVQAAGALCFIQINHPGRQAFLGPRDREYAVAPSQVSGRFYGGPVQIPHALSDTEIRSIIDDFAASAEAIASTAADGVELHFGHGNLVQQFLSSLTNLRTDRWGGSFENRTRFARAVITAIRERIGTDRLVLGARVNATAPGDPAESAVLADFIRMLFDAGGLDYLSVTGGHFSSAWGTAFNLPDSSFRPALWADHARQIRSWANIPVFLVGRILGPRLAEQLLASGAADVVAMVRELIADPDLPAKAAAGHAQRIRPCVGYQSGCWQRGAVNLAIHCAFNPEAGREVEMRETEPVPAARRRVTVIGAGPAGMEAARYAAVLGHRVTLLEAREVLGGSVGVTAAVPHRTEVTAIVDWFAAELAREGVDVRLGVIADVTAVLATEPDAVIVATGAVAPAWYQGPAPSGVVSGLAALAGAEVGDRVVVFDDLGGRTGLSVAEFLATDRRSVQFVTSMSYPGEGLNGTVRAPQMTRLAQAGVAFRADATVIGFADRTVTIRDELAGSTTTVVDVDTMVTVLRPRSADGLAAALDGLVSSVAVVGDARAPRGATEATYEGRMAAVALGSAVAELAAAGVAASRIGGRS